MFLAFMICQYGVLSFGASGAQEQSTTLPPDTVRTTFQSDTVPGFGAVGGVATDALGYVYIADFRNSVWRMGTDGRVTLFADGLYGASGNAVGPRGNLFQSSFNGNTITRISRTGEPEVWVTEGLAGPVGIAVDGNGTLFVCNCTTGTISRVDADRVARTFAEGELFACPNGITFDDRGDLYVVNFNNTLVVRITPDGEVGQFADIPGSGGNGHITFARGAFFITKFRGNQVYRLTRDGTVSVVAGTGTPGEEDGRALEASFTQPNGIAADPSGKVLWVNDLVSRPGIDGPGLVTLRRIRLISLSDVLADASPASGVDGIRTLYQTYLDHHRGEDMTGDAIAYGFQLMSTNRVPEGVALLEINARSFPEHAQSQFSLGEAYRYTGQPERAATQYERTLELDPDHPQAPARLKLVRGG
jgi:hypothetical protein